MILMHDADRRIGDALDFLRNLRFEGLASVDIHDDGLRISGPDLHLSRPDHPWVGPNRSGWWQAVEHHGDLMVAWVSWGTAPDFDEEAAS